MEGQTKENGDLDKAVKEKDRLETKQREYRKPYKNCKKEAEWWTPKWFIPGKNQYTKEDDWNFNGDYWNKSKAKDAGQLDIFQKAFLQLHTSFLVLPQSLLPIL